MRIAGWIIDNLNEYGNCYLPSNLFQLYSLEDVEEEISRLAGYEVMIEKRIIDEIDLGFKTRYNSLHRKKAKEGIMYIVSRIDEGEHLHF